ncbi:MAG: hypothetical protein AAGA29_06500 [Planctomycetota bacterium]
MHTLPTLITDAHGVSVFTTAEWPAEARGGMVLSPRVGASSLRLRTSEPGYFADWHAAGPRNEPVLIVVRRGVLRIGLRDGSHRDFAAGDAFVAADSVPEGETFDAERHGHTAAVVGDEPLEAIHIKLAALPE